jgi:polyisoprenoid-binding protein YceI
MLINMMKYIFYFFFPVLMIGCLQEPKSDNATIGEAQPVEELDQGKEFVIDTSQSIITWVGTKPTGRHNGLIKIKEGTITIIEEPSDTEQKKFTIGNTQIKIDMGSVEVLDLKDDPLQLEKLENHLKSEDFFETELYPEAEFEFISFKPIEEDTVQREGNDYTIIDPTHILNGNLTIKGKTLNVEFPVKADYRNLRFEASAKFNIDRIVWGVNYKHENDPVARATDGFIHNIVNVGFEIIARPKSE